MIPYIFTVVEAVTNASGHVWSSSWITTNSEMPDWWLNVLARKVPWYLIGLYFFRNTGSLISIFSYSFKDALCLLAPITKSISNPFQSSKASLESMPYHGIQMLIFSMRESFHLWHWYLNTPLMRCLLPTYNDKQISAFLQQMVLLNNLKLDFEGNCCFQIHVIWNCRSISKKYIYDHLSALLLIACCVPVNL